MYGYLSIHIQVKPTVWLREVHTKQLSSLQQREQQLLDIIEDIRLVSAIIVDVDGTILSKFGKVIYAQMLRYVPNANWG